MRLNTEILFLLLIKALRPELVCDVGSMDGIHARRFRQILPNSHIIAFEANPENVCSMQEDENIKKDRIEIEHKAVSNRNGILTFYVEHLPAEGGGWRRGISSIRKRVTGSLGTTEVKIPSLRLDTFIKSLSAIFESVALWIDVEGAAFEVLESIEKIRNEVKVVHIEVETQEVWCGEKLKPEVETLMKQMDFIELARGFPPPLSLGWSDFQHDLVFINGRTFAESPLRFKTIVSSAFTITQRFGEKLSQSESFHL
nr:FkbM family methyltransferase [bacterium]